jgi:hypothetical protein
MELIQLRGIEISSGDIINADVYCSWKVVDNGIGPYEHFGTCGTHHDMRVEVASVDSIFAEWLYEDGTPTDLPEDLSRKLLDDPRFYQHIEDELERMHHDGYIRHI